MSELKLFHFFKLATLTPLRDAKWHNVSPDLTVYTLDDPVDPAFPLVLEPDLELVPELDPDPRLLPELLSPGSITVVVRLSHMIKSELQLFCVNESWMCWMIVFCSFLVLGWER